MNQNAVKKKILLPGIVNFVIGLILISTGMGTMLAVELGMTPTSSLPVTVFEAVQFLTAGRWITILQVLFIIGSMIVSKKIKVTHVMSFISTFILGLLIDMVELLLSPIMPGSVIIKLLIVLAACFVLGIGINFLLLSKYPPIPDLMFMNELYIRCKIPVGKTKMITDITAVIIASIISYFVLHEFIHVGIGTVISAFSLGFLIHKIKPFIVNRFDNSVSRSGNKIMSVLDYDLVDLIVKNKA